MRRCAKCVMPDTRPDTPFDSEGVCSACRAYERRSKIDWDERRVRLTELLERHDGRCIVPSSGGKDSHYQVLQLLELGAKPTIVTASTCHLTEIGRANIDNLARYAPTIEITPNRDQRRRLNRIGLEMVGDISWPEHVAIFTLPFKAACHLWIPLIFYGENPQDQYGGPAGSEDAKTMTRRWVSEYGGFLGLRPKDVEAMAGDMSMYQPPSDEEIAVAGVEAHFLGQYIPWDSHRNASQAKMAGMQTAKPSIANWWEHENLDNYQTGLHDHFMYRKYGYGRGCAQISVDVRTGHVTRQQALDWVKQHDGRFPATYMRKHYSEIIDNIGMKVQDLWKLAPAFTNWDLFQERPPHDSSIEQHLKLKVDA